MNKKTIRVPKGWTEILAKKHGVTLQSVRMSLQYVFNSDKAKRIRETALEMLKMESEKPINLIED